MTTNVLYLGAYIFAGQQGVRSAIASLREGVLDVDVLMVLAALGAALIGAPFEGALLLFLFSFSNVLQRHAMERTQRAIESLLTLRPAEALVKRNGTTLKVAVEDLEIGEIVVVRPGEQIPVDGVISEGSTNVDESSLTGESMPVSKALGSPLFAGTLNQSGGIELTVTKRSEDSTLSRMVKLVAEAQAEKSGTQRFLEKAEQYYAMGVIVFTIGVFLVPYLFQAEHLRATRSIRAMTIMVVASPCALIISTPATVLSAIGGAARRGILIKGGSHLETASKIDIVAIDKTGTLTVGKPSLTEIVTADGVHDIIDSPARPGDRPAARRRRARSEVRAPARPRHRQKRRDTRHQAPGSHRFPIHRRQGRGSHHRDHPLPRRQRAAFPRTQRQRSRLTRRNFPTPASQGKNLRLARHPHGRHRHRPGPARHGRHHPPRRPRSWRTNSTASA